MKPTIILLVLAFALIGDLSLSTLQYLSAPIDGDLYAIVLPAPWYAEVLSDPFGFRAVFEEVSYGGAGRYTSHLYFSTYFTYAPGFWQFFVDPVESLYYSAASAKLLAHLGILLIGAGYITGRFHFGRTSFWVAAVAISPFIQAGGLHNRMGLIDRSITYTFFYIIPVLVFLALLFPLYQYALGYKKHPKGFSLGLWTLPCLGMMWLLGSIGPQLQFLMVLTGGLSLAYTVWYQRNEGESIIKSVQRPFLGKYRQLGALLLALIAFGAWGYISGLQNTENADGLPLMQTLIQAAKGIVFHYIQVWPMWFIAAGIAYHLYSLRSSSAPEVRAVRRFLLLSFLGICIYMLVLPFGGYRPYRPYIYRYDLLIPVTLWLVYALLTTGRLYLKYVHAKGTRRWYLPLAIAFSIVLYAHDLRIKDANVCEKSKLVKLSEAETDFIVLDADCPVLAWEPDENPYYTKFKVQLLQRWGIVQRDIEYIQKPSSVER